MPAEESRNSEDYKFWNHEMWGLPLYLYLLWKLLTKCNVWFAEKDTKRSSVFLLCLVSFFANQTIAWEKPQPFCLCKLNGRNQVSLVSAHFTCTSVLSAWFFDWIIYYKWSFWLFMTKILIQKSQSDLIHVNSKWNEPRHDSLGWNHF